MTHTKIYFYRNLHTGTFSAKYRGLVIDHPECVLVVNATLSVSTQGRERVIETKRKNVHATVGATPENVFVMSAYKPDVSRLIPVYYNPYKTASFMCENEPIHNVDALLLMDNKMYKVV